MNAWLCNEVKGGVAPVRQTNPALSNFESGTLKLHVHDLCRLGATGGRMLISTSLEPGRANIVKTPRNVLPFLSGQQNDHDRALRVFPDVHHACSDTTTHDCDDRDEQCTDNLDDDHVR